MLFGYLTDFRATAFTEETGDARKEVVGKGRWSRAEAYETGKHHFLTYEKQRVGILIWIPPSSVRLEAGEKCKKGLAFSRAIRYNN